MLMFSAFYAPLTSVNNVRGWTITIRLESTDPVSLQDAFKFLKHRASLVDDLRRPFPGRLERPAQRRGVGTKSRSPMVLNQAMSDHDWRDRKTKLTLSTTSTRSVTSVPDNLPWTFLASFVAEFRKALLIGGFLVVAVTMLVGGGETEFVDVEAEDCTAIGIGVFAVEDDTIEAGESTRGADGVVVGDDRQRFVPSHSEVVHEGDTRSLPLGSVAITRPRDRMDEIVSASLGEFRGYEGIWKHSTSSNTTIAAPCMRMIARVIMFGVNDHRKMLGRMTL